MAVRRAVAMARTYPFAPRCNLSNGPGRTHVRGIQWPPMAADELVVHGAREHNLKDITVRLPRNALICITGLSGSGKSSLAFDTIYAEGQRRYVESLTAYARQFLQMMEKPDVDSIDGLSPGDLDRPEDDLAQPALDGRHGDRDLRLPAPALRARRPAALPDLRPADRRPVDRPDRRADPAAGRARASPSTRRSCATARASSGTLLEELRSDGFTRVKVDGEQRLLEEPIELDKKFKHTIEVVVDRLVMKADLRQRLTQSVETATSLAEGLVVVDLVDGGRAADLSRELRLPRARRLAARAGAAHLLLQLAARRLPALHRPRRAARDRPRPARPGHVALARRRRARAVVGRQLELLRLGRSRRSPSATRSTSTCRGAS